MRKPKRYWVRRHRRRYPSKAQPHWFIVKANTDRVVEAIRCQDGTWTDSWLKAGIWTMAEINKEPEFRDRLLVTIFPVRMKGN